MIKKLSFTFLWLFIVTSIFAQSDWEEDFTKNLPVYGHRNWILVADAAYPIQVKPGIETIYTGEDQIDVLNKVLSSINDAPNISPELFLDIEIDYVPEKDYSGLKNYKRQLDKLFKDEKVTKLMHEDLLKMVDEAGQNFKVLVLKTNLTIPYTSVFIRLDCGYWNTVQEDQMRKSMNN